jgi:hypothetical protein
VPKYSIGLLVILKKPRRKDRAFGSPPFQTAPFADFAARISSRRSPDDAKIREEKSADKQKARGSFRAFLQSYFFIG